MEQLNVQLLNRGDDERRDIDSRIQALDQQLLYLDAQLAQISPSAQIFTSTGERVMSPADRLKMLRSDYEKAAATYSPEHPDVVRLKRLIEGLEGTVGQSDGGNDRTRQIQDTEGKLAVARQRYAPDHPDVMRLERQLAALNASPASPSTPTPGSSLTSVDSGDNPAYIQMKAQREVLTSERKSLGAKRVALATRMADLTQRLESSPGVERDYTALRRDLENTQAKYHEVRQKQMEAQLAQSLEVERKGERFSLIEPPLVPEEPASPNRRMIIVLGLVMALVAAVATALLLEFLDGTIRGAADIGALVTAPPLAVIPLFASDEHAHRNRRRRWLIAPAVLFVLVLILAAVHLYYKPLDVLWAVLLRRLGG